MKPRLETIRARHPRRRFTSLALEILERRELLTTGIGTYNPADDRFALRNEASAGPMTAGEFQFASPGSVPVVGDWNGDGQDDFGLYNPTTATWYLKYGAEAGPPNAGVFTFGPTGAV